MITYFDFDEYNSIEKTVKLVRDKPIEEQKVDVKVVEILCTYLRNACVSLEEDPDSEFFKNGNRNGNGKSKSTNNNESKSKSKGGTTKEKQQKQEQEEEEERPPDYNIIISPEQWQTKLIQKYNKLYDTVQMNLPHLWHSLEFDLSIKNILHIKDCSLPFAGVVLGRPTKSTTSVLRKWICYNRS